MTAPLPDVIRGLLAPSAYDHAVGRVELIQTHISYVLLAGDFAYKVKKPLDLHFLNYSTLERRRLMCEEEVRLNRRLCAEAYVGVSSIVRDGDAYRIGAPGEAVEYAVKMHRMLRERMLPELLARGEASEAHVRALARRIAAFHRDAATDERIAGFGSVETLQSIWEENFEQTASHVGDTITAAQRDGIRAYVERFLRDNAALIDERARAGRIRDCHGDLRSDAVVIHEDGSICVMDCIEFSDRIRCSDVASDIGFLAMDFEFRGRPDLADELLAAYLGDAPDETLPLVLDFYRCHRAYVRGKVDGMQLDEPEVPEEQRRAARARAQAYFSLAHRYATARHPQTLVMMIGLAGSGKSYVANAIACRMGAAVVTSDVVRREMADERAVSSPGAPYGSGAYSIESRARVYDEMHRRAVQHLAQGRSVVLDATHISRGDRLAARRLAQDAGARLLAVHVVADETTVRARLDERTAAGDAVSDARWNVYLSQRERFEPPDELSEADLVRIDSGRPLHENVVEVLKGIASAAE
ncbi:MAG: AAA family ATPase [Chloroflexi bacterium]|nr:AAA family ATPase [Chloroflexota bacterium]